MKIILAFDLGLSSLKTIIATSNGRSLFQKSVPYPTHSPRSGWVEQDPKDWVKALRESMSEIPLELKRKVDAISFSGHMSSALIIDKEGNPLSKCLTLTDTRGQKELGEFKKLVSRSIDITGNGFSSTHWVFKVLWLLDNISDINKAYKVLFAKDYLRYYLCGNIGTEYTDCGNTGLIDYTTLDWDEQAVNLSTLPKNILPTIHRPYDQAGNLLIKRSKETGLKEGIPIFYGGADMACGALGSGIKDGGDEVVITLGSCATMLSTLDSTIDKRFGVGKVSFHPYIFPGTLYSLGSHFTGGLGANWFSGLFSGNVLEPNYDELNKIASEAEQILPGCEDLIMLPFLVGSGSPYNKGTDKGSYIGLTLSTTRGAMFRSLLEGITYNLLETEIVFEEMANQKLNIFIGGGGVSIHLWPEIIADVFGRDIMLLDNKDVSTWGAIRLGFFGLGVIKNIFPEISYSENKRITYNKENNKIYQEKFKKYRSLYNEISNWLSQ